MWPTNTHTKFRAPNNLLLDTNKTVHIISTEISYQIFINFFFRVFFFYMSDYVPSQRMEGNKSSPPIPLPQQVISRLLNKFPRYVRKLFRCSLTIFWSGISTTACRYHDVRILSTVPSYSVTWSSNVKLLSVALELCILCRRGPPSNALINPRYFLAVQSSRIICVCVCVCVRVCARVCARERVRACVCAATATSTPIRSFQQNLVKFGGFSFAAS